MNQIFTFSFRGNILQLEKFVLQALPQRSQFAEYVKKKHHLGLNEVLQQDRNDLIIYVNRSSSLFNHILDYIEHGELHYPQYICPVIILKELEYWGYSEKHLGACCLDRILKDRENNDQLKTISKEWINDDTKTDYTLCSCSKSGTNLVKVSDTKGCGQSESVIEEQQPIRSTVAMTHIESERLSTKEDIFPYAEGLHTQCCFKQKLSKIIKAPLSSWPGKIWLIIILSAIAVSTVTIMLEFEPRIRHPRFEEVTKTTNLTLGEGLYMYFYDNSLPEMWVIFLDFACVFILTLDFIARCIVSQRRCRFLIQPCNVLDILGILPVWIVFIFAIMNTIQKWSTEDWKIMKTYFGMTIGVLHMFRMFRLRLILLHFKSLRVIVLAYKNSTKALITLSILLTMASVVYGGLMFMVEVYLNCVDSFPSAFHAQWWALITLTTVGYGDFVPKTDAGYVIGVSCALFGIAIVAMTTTIIIINFTQVYTNVETIERKNKYQQSTIKRQRAES